MQKPDGLLLMKKTFIEVLKDAARAGLYVENGIKDLEKELSIPEGFFNKLRDENDWSFIIKLHALFEAALAFLITKKVGDNRLLNIFAEMEMSQRKGKLAFVKELGLLEKRHQTFIKCLSELRNDLIHNISSITFDLQKYFNELTPGKKKTFIKHFFIFGPEESPDKGFEEILSQKLKFAICLSATTILYKIYIEKENLRTVSSGNNHNSHLSGTETL